MARPPTIKKGPASHYATGDETIVEIHSSTTGTGCLLAVRVAYKDGEPYLLLEPYRADDGVFVRMHGNDVQVNK